MSPNVGSTPKRLWYVAPETTDNAEQALRSLIFYSNSENLVLPPGCRSYGPEAGLEFFAL